MHRADAAASSPADRESAPAAFVEMPFAIQAQAWMAVPELFRLTAIIQSGDISIAFSNLVSNVLLDKIIQEMRRA